ncbi:MAG: SigE family RNA polymerase sigma factor [Nocardioides sp.]
MRERDSEAFDAFVRGRLPSLLRLGRALTGSEQAGADLVQDALERTLVRWGRIESDDPEGYVRKVMVTRNISLWRRLRRERLTAEVPETAYDDPVADPALWAALAALPPRQRAVIVLRYYEDLTEVQTANALEVSVGTVKSQASRAMAKLRSLLADRADRADQTPPAAPPAAHPETPNGGA